MIKTLIDMSGVTSHGRLHAGPAERKPFESEIEAAWKAGCAAPTDGDEAGTWAAVDRAVMSIRGDSAIPEQVAQKQADPPKNEKKPCRVCDPSVGLVCDDCADVPGCKPAPAWTPKVGEMCEFSDDGIMWAVQTLTAVYPEAVMPWRAKNNGPLVFQWKLCRPLAAKEPEWIEWKGGECPVAPNAYVELRFNDGSQGRFHASTTCWNNSGDLRPTAYRVRS